MSEEYYSWTLDISPEEHREGTRLWKFWENLKEGKLITIKCKSCNKVTWLPGVICRYCLSDNIGWVELPKTNKVIAYTV